MVACLTPNRSVGITEITRKQHPIYPAHTINVVRDSVIELLGAV